MNNNKIVLTVLACDTTGIEGGSEYSMKFGPDVCIKVRGAFRMSVAAALSQLLEEYGVFVTSIEQADEGCFFAMIIFGDMGDNIVSLDHLRTVLAERGKQYGASIKIQKDDLFRYMHRI